MPVYQSLKDVPQEAGKYLVRIPIAVDLSGLEIALWTHVFRGARPGATLTLLGGLHGNEWQHLDFFLHFAETIDVNSLSGTVLMAPIVNAAAFGQLARAVPDDSDNPDPNRSFPGKGRRFTWIAEQIATTIAAELLAMSSCLLDFHAGIWGAAMGSSIVGTDYSDPEVSSRCREVALAFGNPLVFATKMVGSFPGPRSSQGYSGEVLKLPCCGSMLGGAGFDREQEAAWSATNLQGIRNTMILLGMLDGELKLPEQYLLYELVHRVNPRNGGLLLPAHDVEVFGRPVKEGERLGRVVSPFTFETLEELHAPCDGYLAYWARSYPLRPGDWAYGVIPSDHPRTEWIDRPDLRR